MAAIGSLLFCTDCGNLLNASTGIKDQILICEVCGTGCRDTSSNKVTTKSKPNAFPSALSKKHDALQEITEDDIRRDAVDQRECPQCGRKEMRYYTQQLRSADEGSTVFYRCECGFKETVNN